MGLFENRKELPVSPIALVPFFLEAVATSSKPKRPRFELRKYNVKISASLVGPLLREYEGFGKREKTDVS